MTDNTIIAEAAVDSLLLLRKEKKELSCLINNIMLATSTGKKD